MVEWKTRCTQNAVAQAIRVRVLVHAPIKVLMAEMVDAPASSPGVERRAGSMPAQDTTAGLAHGDAARLKPSHDTGSIPEAGTNFYGRLVQWKNADFTRRLSRVRFLHRLPIPRP